MYELGKRASLKVLISRRRALLRGPLHIFFVILISISTFVYFNYSQVCWVHTDPFCPTIEEGNLIFKWIIAVTQFLGIGLLLWDIDKRMQTLTGSKLKTYFLEKIKTWYSLWFNRNFSVDGVASFSINATSNVRVSLDRQKGTVEEQLAYLQKRISDVEVEISKERSERTQLQLTIKAEIDKVYKSIDESNTQILKKVTDVHINGYTLQMWSMFLIAYSTILSVYV